MAILSKLQDNEAIILEDLTIAADQVKTKEVATVLKALKKTLQVPIPRAEGEELTPEIEAQRKSNWSASPG